jgi:hypothetical protein
MVRIAELLDGNVTLEVGCINRLYLNDYKDKREPVGLALFVCEQMGQTSSAPVVLGAEIKFRRAVLPSNVLRVSNRPMSLIETGPSQI